MPYPNWQADWNIRDEFPDGHVEVIRYSDGYYVTIPAEQWRELLQRFNGGRLRAGMSAVGQHDAQRKRNRIPRYDKNTQE